MSAPEADAPGRNIKALTDAQIAAWPVLRARYGIPLEHVYAHNWVDFKDAGCALATMARQWGE